MASQFPIFLVDAFTSTAFSGNPAAVVLLTHDKVLSEEKLSSIAKEMNQAETAYIKCLAPEDNFVNACRFGLRWFTPKVEVNLCGHATLASAAVLFLECKNENNTIYFETLSGELIVRREGDKITLDFPLNPPEPTSLDAVKGLVQVVADSCGDEVRDFEFSPTTRKLIVRLPDSMSRSDLEKLALEPEALFKAQPSGPVRGVIITLLATPGGGEQDYDYFTRYFAPWVGIPEDAVTGSAHTVSGAYWAKRLAKKTLKARQCSARGGDVYLRLRDDARIELSGHATVVLSGHFRF